VSFEAAAEIGMEEEKTWYAADKIQNLFPQVRSENVIACAVNNFATCLR